MVVTTEHVALITGANTGIGLALAHRLLEEFSNDLIIVLGCRTRSKVEAARDELLLVIEKRYKTMKMEGKQPYSQRVEILDIDVSNTKSTLRAAENFSSRFSRLDFLFLNAGVLPSNGIDYASFFHSLFTLNLSRLWQLTMGGLILRQNEVFTSEGLPSVFATNVFGHFILLKELEPVLIATASAHENSKILWTGSTAAKKSSLDINDILHCESGDPYGASKYVVDLVTGALNRRLNKKGVLCYTTCPGVVITNLTCAFVPAFLWWFLLYPLMLVLRVIAPSLTMHPRNGAESLRWLALSPVTTSINNNELSNIAKLHPNPRLKWFTCCSILGNCYSDGVLMNNDSSLEDAIYLQLEKLANQFIDSSSYENGIASVRSTKKKLI